MPPAPNAKKSRIPPKIKSARRSRCDDVLRLIRDTEDTDLKAAMMKDLKAFARKRKRPLKDWSLYRFVKDVPKGGGNDDLVADWVEQSIPKLLRTEQCDPSLIKAVDAILHPEVIAASAHSRAVENRTNAPPGDGGKAKAAIAQLFEMMESDYSVSSSPAIEGEYFGYRRSAHHGDIVRFHITISLDASTGLMKFDNHYRRRGIRWRVEGFGFDVRQTTYLFGHAASKVGGRRLGRGLRLFSLVPYDSFGWYVGPIISMDSDENPIAARILLIPASQHSSYKDISDAEERQSKMLSMIEEKVTPDILDKEIVFDDEDEKNPFSKIACSLLVQAAIFNGSFTTLNARPGLIEQTTIRQFKQLFAFQQRAIDLARDMQGSILPFLRIALHGEEIIPVDNKRSDYLRDDDNDDN